MPPFREEALGQERQGRGGARGAEIVPAAAEPLVYEDRDRRGACPVEAGGQVRGVRIRTQVARRRRAPLDLRNRAQAGASTCVSETQSAPPVARRPRRTRPSC